MSGDDRLFLSGNEAVALAAKHGRVSLGTGYPGTPSTEILENFAELGGKAQWAPNEKVALEVAIGVALGRADALVTMKHVGLNVAADPLFSVAYTGVPGALVIVSADDPGMASSQNEQDNRRYAVAAGVPMLEPSDSQEAYDFTLAAIEISRHWETPVLLRMTTRVCHSKGVVTPGEGRSPPETPRFLRDREKYVMIPAYARRAHKRMREKLRALAAVSASPRFVREDAGAGDLGIITSGISYMHVREAAPEAAVLKLGMTYPLPLETIREFAGRLRRCLVVEEGDPYLVEQIRAAGIGVEDKPEMYRFGELDVARVRRIVAGDVSPEPVLPPAKPPQLCNGCPHRVTMEILRELDCIVAGDIGCYSLGVLPPFQAIDALICMGAGIGMGLGLRHVLPEDQARRVVSIIGDSTFVHTGIPGLAEMVYNPPPTGHLVLILDNGTTAMTGMQEHPGTGRRLNHEPTGRVDFEKLSLALGIENVRTIDPLSDREGLKTAIRAALAGNELSVIIVRRTCLLAAGMIRQYEAAAEKSAACDASTLAPG
ncbi:MAG: thiamine pyrophosphate-dependent enzyme [Thermogutta sp.]